MKIVLFVNQNKDPEGLVTKAAMSVLAEAGVSCVVFDGDESVFDGAYAALSLGGDGTLLRCAKAAFLHGAAVLGIHLGHTGYLAHIDPDNLGRLKDIASFKMKKRPVLQMENGIAVNDFTFSRGMTVQTVSLDIGVDGRPLGSFLGDGVIISTPTGSTGYALSAGGPVVDPDLNATLITPICAHTSHAHAFVIAPDRVVTVTPSFTERRHIYLSADGCAPRRLEQDERIEIRVSNHPLLCLEPDEHSFIDNVRLHRL